MNATIRPLSPPHKGLRHLFSQFSLISGVLQPDHAEHFSHWRKTGDDLFLLLNDHSQNEIDFVFGPLQAKAESFWGEFQDEHARLSAQAKAIEQDFLGLGPASSSDDFYRFYLDFTEFHAANLALMAHEDRVIEPLMMQHFTNDELQLQQLGIMSRMPFDTLLLWFQYIVPARQPAENLQVLRAFRQSAPAQAWGRVVAILREVLNETDFNELMSQA